MTAKNRTARRLELPPELLERLEAAAAGQGRDAAEYARQGLELLLALDEYPAGPPGETEEDAARRLLTLLRLMRPLYDRLFPVPENPDSTDIIRAGRGHIDAFNRIDGHHLNDYREWELRRRLGEPVEEPTPNW